MDRTRKGLEQVALLDRAFVATSLLAGVHHDLDGVECHQTYIVSFSLRTESGGPVTVSVLQVACRVMVKSSIKIRANIVLSISGSKTSMTP